MQRYFLNQDTGKIEDKDDLFHITKVMRMKTGDQIITCFNDICHKSKITVLDKEVTYKKETLMMNKTIYDITLIQGLPKGSKTEELIKSTTIFGIKQIYLTEMKRSIAKLKNDDAKLTRYHKIAKEASELAHRQNIPQIEFKKDLKHINLTNFDHILLADEDEHTVLLNQLILDPQNEKIAIIIGPEGGIDPEERMYLKSIGAQTISLGEFIMPTELASLYPLSYIYAKKS